MAKFSEGFNSSSEFYIESDNGKRKTVIDIQSGNSYEEITENGQTKRLYFMNESDGSAPVGVYNLFEKDQLSCFYPVEGDATIDMYELLTSIGNINAPTVQVKYDGANRLEIATDSWGDTLSVVFWGDTSVPLSIGKKTDMEDFIISINLIAPQIPSAEMKASLKNGLKGYSLYIPPNPYA